MNIPRRMAPYALTVFTVTAVFAVPAGPAHAVSNPTRHYQESVVNSDNKSVTVDCPAGTKVYGAGGSIAGGYGNVVLDEFVPNEDLTQVSAQGLERPGYAADWTVWAWAICGPATLNQQRIELSTAQNSTSPKNAVTSCPANLKVYGIGAEIINGQGNVVLDDLEISQDLTEVNIGAYEIGGWSGSWAVKAYAICANPAAGGMSRVTLSTSMDGVSPKTVTASGCLPGTKLHGVGGEISGGAGDVIFEDLTPNNLLNTVSATGYEVGGSSGASWKITSYGVCAA